MEKKAHFSLESVAALARLRLKPAEKEKLQADLEAILGYIQKLDALKTEGTDTTSHVLNLENVFRSDQPCATDLREEVLQHAPCREGPFFKVPKVVDPD